MAERELTARQERAVERLLEAEGLTGGLNDVQAEALLRWAADQAVVAAAPDRSDAETAAFIQAIGTAIRRVAREYAAEDDPQRLVARATQLLAPALSAAQPFALPAVPASGQTSVPQAAPHIADLARRRISLTSYCVG
ncbi:MAG: hypothetical protein HC822_25625 [Oscillochloris sp.]|nr:hypothetical protein [Oscillochloris sp.]